MPAFAASLRCPLCREPLRTTPPTWRCGGGHSFDVAREGYVNLLPVQHKRSLSPGDSADSVNARRRFLAAGHYQPLRDAVVASLTAAAPRQLLDLGCGEGYYTHALRAVVPEVIGLDIAKPAIRLAARQQPDVTWLVASAAQLPLADASCDAVTSLFSPLPAGEIARVLRDDGLLRVVTPAPEHLWAFREALFGEVRPHVPEKFLATFVADFRLEGEQRLRYPLRLGQSDLHDLMAMTPYAWKARPTARAALAARDSLATEAAFTLLSFRRNPR